VTARKSCPDESSQIPPLIAPEVSARGGNLLPDLQDDETHKGTSKNLNFSLE
jgi:hypothetical protein